MRYHTGLHLFIYTFSCVEPPFTSLLYPRMFIGMCTGSQIETDWQNHILGLKWEFMCAWRAYLQLLTNSLRGERGHQGDRVSRVGGSGEINFMEMADQRRPPTTSCIMQQKKGMMFVSEYFLIFIRYIFQLNWNLSGRIGREWHHSSSWAVSPRLMRCNKKRERAREGQVDCRAPNEMQFRVNGSQKHITANMAWVNL